MIVTTLPIAYVEGRPLRILSSSIISSILSSVTDARVCFPLNAVSVRESSKKSLSQRLVDFGDCLGTLGLLNDKSIVLSDGSDEVLQNSEDLLDNALSSGLCFFQESLITHCDCGRLEIPANVLNEVRSDTHQSMYSSAGDVQVCRVCKSELHDSLIQGLFFEQGLMESPGVLPNNHGGRLSGIINDIAGKSFYISRSFRTMSEGLSLDGHGCLDPDFHSALSLVHLWSLNRDDLVLVIAINHFYRACRAYAVAKSFAPDLNLTIVAHPMFSSENNLMKLPVNEAVDFMGSKAAVRFLFGTMLQWTRYDSCCSVKDMKRVASCDTCSVNVQKQKIPFDKNILRKVNRNSYLSLLSKMRKTRDLYGYDRALYLSLT